MAYQEPASVNADLTQRAVVNTKALGWVPSPRPGVERRFLERDGGEVARATSIVRYAPGSAFPAHEHGGGEEYLVLEGTFSDEHGDFPVGTYVRNPPGTSHAPFSREGCTIFVKLRQMRLIDEPQVVIDTNQRSWSLAERPGYWRMPLFEQEGREERVALEKLDSGVAVPSYTCEDGEEILVLHGTFSDGARAYEAGTWLRNPPDFTHGMASETGCTLWVKRGHLIAA